MSDEFTALALEAYNKTRIGRNYLPPPDTPEGARKVERLAGILRGHVERLDRAAREG